MSSVLVVKNEAPSYSSEGIIRAFKEHYDEVYELDWQKIRFNEGVEGVRKRIMAMAMMYKPEVVFLHIQNADILDANTLDFLNENAFTILYTFDVREDIAWMKELAPHLGLILFGDFKSIEECKIEGIDNVDYLQSSCDFELYKPTPTENNYGEIIFIGNNFLNTNLKFELSQQRVDMVKYMKESFGEIFKVYGMGWEGSKILNPKEEIEAYSNCKIAICHNNFLRDGYNSDRIYRAMGCGAFVINHSIKPDEDFWFTERWETLPQLKEKIKFWLYYEDLKMSAISRREVMIKTHSWSVRILRLKTLINEHTNKRVANRPNAERV
jgi:hypothetical protein